MAVWSAARGSGMYADLSNIEQVLDLIFFVVQETHVVLMRSVHKGIPLPQVVAEAAWRLNGKSSYGYSNGTQTETCSHLLSVVNQHVARFLPFSSKGILISSPRIAEGQTNLDHIRTQHLFG